MASIGDILNAPSHLGQDIGSKIGDAIGTSQKEKLSKLVQEAGWRGDSARTATAVFMAEGGGLVDGDGNIKCERNFAGCCVGLVQANIDAHKDITMQQACDPLYALKWAHRLYLKEGFRPWEAYTNGSYRSHLGKDIEIKVHQGASKYLDPGQAIDNIAPGNPVKDVGSAIASVANTLKALFDPAFWLRGGKVAIGAAFILMALGYLMFKSGVPQKAAKGAAVAAVL